MLREIPFSTAVFLCLGIPPEMSAGYQIDRLKELARSLHERLARSVSRSRHFMADKSGHFVQGDQPEIVLEAIRFVIQ